MLNGCSGMLVMQGQEAAPAQAVQALRAWVSLFLTLFLQRSSLPCVDYPANDWPISRPEPDFDELRFSRRIRPARPRLVDDAVAEALGDGICAVLLCMLDRVAWLYALSGVLSLREHLPARVRAALVAWREIPCSCVPTVAAT